MDGVQTSYTQRNLENGITVQIPRPLEGQASRSSTLSFKVKVNKSANNTLIKNTAQYRDVTVIANPAEKNTNEVTVKYVEPIISQSKSYLTQNKEQYVVQGEKVTYTINISNEGGQEKDVIVKDNIPQGTTFVNGSVKIDGVVNTSITSDNLKNGIKMRIPAETKNLTLSFEVTVNDITDEDIIRNTATVDDTPTNEVTLRYVEPIISKRKEMTTEHRLNYVVQGEKIRYTIVVTNAGGIGKNVVIKDVVPEGTTLVPGSIKLNAETILDAQNKPIDAEQLKNGLKVTSPEKIKSSTSSTYEPSITTISFEVIVDDIEDEDIIRNIATVDNENTNDVAIRYVEPIITQIKEIETEYNLDYVVQGEKIKYTIRIMNAGGIGKNVLVKDVVPKGTTLVPESIKLNDEVILDAQNKPIDAEQLKNGLKVTSPAKVKSSTGSTYEPSITTISFEVIVDDIEDEDIIRNIATVDNENTNNVTIKYVESIISQKKEATTQYKKDYVVGDEIIKYSIIVQNDGSLEKEVIVKDKIPQGVTFVKNSILVNGEEYKNELDEPCNEEDLKEGISVMVPPKQYIDDNTDDNLNQDDEKNDSEQEDKKGSNEKDEENNLNQKKEQVYDEKNTENKEKLDDDTVEDDITSDNTVEDNDETEEDDIAGDDNTTEEKREYIPGKTVVSFEVIVNRLEKDTDTAKIVNIATVDGEETNEVIHEVYPFNMKIEKTIKEVLKNAQYQDVGEGKIFKTEIVDKEVNKTSFIAKYKIIVTNTGKVEGSAVVEDAIPEGYIVAESNPSYWTNLNNEKLQTKVEALQPGESKELEVILIWQNRQDNFGVKVSRAEIVKIKNESNAKETSTEDNKSEATIIMGIVTGKTEHNYIIVYLVAGIIVIMGIIIIKKEII